MILLLATFGLLVGATGAGPRSVLWPEAAREEAYIVLLRLRWDVYAAWKETGKWQPDSATSAALAGHASYWTRQRDEGRAILAGGMKGDYWDNAALIIFRAASRAAADSLVAGDPAVRSHHFQAQVRGFDVHWTGALQPPR